MPDNIPDSPSPGQILAGSPPQVQNAPLDSRPGQPPSLPAQPPAQAQAPTPQQVTAARHNALGQVTSFLFGNQRDPNTGDPVPQKPGAIFRSLLAGALLGGAIGSEGHSTSPTGGFISGLARGGNAVTQQEYARQQAAQEQNLRKQQMSLEEQKFEEEKTVHAGQMEQWNIQNLMAGREADYRDREQLLKENEQDANIQKWAISQGGYLAPSIPHNAEPGNSQQLMQDMTRDPARFNPPAGIGRLLVKSYAFNGLNHDSKNGWTEKDGKPVDWNNHITWSIYYVPSNSTESKPISMSASEWTRLYGVKFPAGTDPNATFNVKAITPLVGVATQNRKQTHDDENQSFKEKHDALAATVNSARTNISQAESEKRELLRQQYNEADPEVQEIDKTIKAEQKREQDAIDEMHPRIRERVTKQNQTPATQPTRPATSPAVSAPKKGDSQVYGGFTYNFDGTQWVKGKPAR